MPVVPPDSDPAGAQELPPPPDVPPPPEPHAEARETAEMRLRREARSRRHLMTHLPKNPWCPICADDKVRAVCAKAQPRKEGNPEVDPGKFGDLLLADHIVLSDPEEWGISGESAGLNWKDVGTGWRDLMPMESKSAENTRAALRDFVGNRHGKIHGIVHSDRAKEINVAVDGLRKDKVYDWVHSKAAPHRETSRGASAKLV